MNPALSSRTEAPTPAEAPTPTEAPTPAGARPPAPDFHAALATRGLAPLRRRSLRTVQVNLGKLCNQACHHCHVEAGPRRTEIMQPDTAACVLERLAATAGVEILDLTGGAPELCPSFAGLVRGAREQGLRVMVRCNLTVIYEPGMQHLPAFYRDNGVELVCSLPCYTADNVDRQRGKGVFGKSIEALRALNALGYGRPDSELELSLVYNPVGAFLPPSQAELEAKYRGELRRLFSIEFDRLFTITNMPIKRFAEALERSGEHEAYMGLLVNHFNAATVENLMCRDMVSVGWDGALYDCDFNQMLEIAAEPAAVAAAKPAGHRTQAPTAARAAEFAPSKHGSPPRRALSVFDIESFAPLGGAAIRTGPHCFGCTAGAGSSCGGELT